MASVLAAALAAGWLSTAAPPLNDRPKRLLDLPSRPTVLGVVNGTTAYVLDQSGCQLFAAAIPSRAQDQRPAGEGGVTEGPGDGAGSGDAWSETAAGGADANPWANLTPIAGGAYNDTLFCAVTSAAVESDGTVYYSDYLSVYATALAPGGSLQLPARRVWKLNASLTSQYYNVGTAAFSHAAGVALVSLSDSNGDAGVLLRIDLATGRESTAVSGYNKTPLYPLTYDDVRDQWYYVEFYNLRRVNGSDGFGGPSDVVLEKGYPAQVSCVRVDHGAGLAFTVRVDAYYNRSIRVHGVDGWDNERVVMTSSGVSSIGLVPSSKTVLTAVNDQPDFTNVYEQGLGAVGYDGTGNATTDRALLWEPFLMTRVKPANGGAGRGGGIGAAASDNPPTLCYTDSNIGVYCWNVSAPSDSIVFANWASRLNSFAATDDGRSWLVLDQYAVNGSGLYTSPLYDATYPKPRPTLVVQALNNNVYALNSPVYVDGVNGRVYWGEVVAGSTNQSSVRSAKLDGTDVRTLVASLPGFLPGCIAALPSGKAFALCDQNSSTLFSVPIRAPGGPPHSSRKGWSPLATYNITRTAEWTDGGATLLWNDWYFGGQTGSLHRIALAPDGKPAGDPEVVLAGVAQHGLGSTPAFAVAGKDVYMANPGRMWSL